ncbi:MULTISPECIES: DNA-binding transcriptional regulator DsdC [unclassified Gilliamella]|uniref:DNA-binding transcriptional regulator DsdC n=1 Tax=unclassified Gilliamella TaxID=2685620 RepID=UPI00080EB97A|nr:DNA-binding transcriptional regulator DsdC [Gilliamella apicola]OCG18758.1 colanic acid biosynthesis glycosyltransferase WcaA [Gilliamella apicola]OCG22159.1 colanic acid biosynthesis glycosyltransferase WcaA [Gilliamella apicola]
MYYGTKFKFLNKNRIINRYQLAKLYTFESVARHLSFALAAEELCISPSAVSHQINKLEEELDIKLFKRFHRRIELTHDGKNLFNVVKKSFNSLNQEILEIKNQELSNQLTIYSSSAFTQAWLIPKLSQFARQYPFISLNVLSGNKVINFNQHRIDLAIYYNDLDNGDLSCDHLMDETIVPVCSPYYAEQHNLYNNVDNLKHCVLLHDNQNNGYDSNFDEWNNWGNYYSLSYDFNILQNIFFDRFDYAVAAAINHVGLAMGRKQVIGKYLKSEQLVTPFAEMEAPCSKRYYICKSKGKHNPKADIFIQWLKHYFQ